MDDQNEEHLETTRDAGNDDTEESAEDQVVRLGEELAKARSEVTEIQAHHAAMERERAIEAALVEQGAVDLETARLVVESCLEKDEGKTVMEVLAEVQEQKPFLFRPPAPPVPPETASGVMSAHGGGAGGVIKRAEKEARESGHRRDVLRFMRLRRGR